MGGRAAALRRDASVAGVGPRGHDRGHPRGHAASGVRDVRIPRPGRAARPSRRPRPPTPGRPIGIDDGPSGAARLRSLAVRPAAGSRRAGMVGTGRRDRHRPDPGRSTGVGRPRSRPSIIGADTTAPSTAMARNPPTWSRVCVASRSAASGRSRRSMAGIPLSSVVTAHPAGSTSAVRTRTSASAGKSRTSGSSVAAMIRSHPGPGSVQPTVARPATRTATSQAGACRRLIGPARAACRAAGRCRPPSRGS